jgi:formate--tetrahydrofolate ligase
MTDIEIAQAVSPRPIASLARERLGIPEEALELYGRHKAKLSLEYLAGLDERPDGKLVLVTAISPTPAGEGKTTTVIGLGDALNRIGRRAVIALRQPSLGPVFGIKGGATGGGRAQVVPMEDINLHFTGDFAAVGLAHNLLAALLDNHVHHGNALGIDIRRSDWPRVLELNDRALRHVVVGLDGPAGDHSRDTRFDIVAASEIMAILCLAASRDDLKARLADIVVARTIDGRTVRAADLNAQGAMAALLRDAIRPNLVQTLEGTPALVHGGPFANIAHGCNSVLATRAALKLGEFAVTEAGFGSDLGAEKFIDIKCRGAGLRPDVAVLVASVRALKYQGGVAAAELDRPDPPAIERGMVNLERHLSILREVFGLPCVVALNQFSGDRDDETELVLARAGSLGVSAVTARHWSQGGAGAESLAQAVVRASEPARPALRFAYDDGQSLWDKTRAVATSVYGAADIEADARVREQIATLERDGFARLPVCIAKTPYSFSSDPALRGAPVGHLLNVREVRLAAGARFVVMVCGDVMTMPGLPSVPAAQRIDVDAQGRITGLA